MFASQIQLNIINFMCYNGKSKLCKFIVSVSVVRIGVFCADFYSGVIQCFGAIVKHLISFEFYTVSQNSSHL